MPDDVTQRSISSIRASEGEGTQNSWPEPRRAASTAIGAQATITAPRDTAIARQAARR